MKITVNNKEVDTSSHTLQQLSHELGLPERGVAMAVNNRMIPRMEWETTPLEEGVSVVVIQAACGG